MTGKGRSKAGGGSAVVAGSSHFYLIITRHVQVFSCHRDEEAKAEGPCFK